MTLSSVIVTYRKMITLWLAALTTVGSIAGGSLWLFQEVAWKRDVDRVKQELVAKSLILLYHAKIFLRCKKRHFRVSFCLTNA